MELFIYPVWAGISPKMNLINMFPILQVQLTIKFSGIKVKYHGNAKLKSQIDGAFLTTAYTNIANAQCVSRSMFILCIAS